MIIFISAHYILIFFSILESQYPYRNTKLTMG